MRCGHRKSKIEATAPPPEERDKLAHLRHKLLKYGYDCCADWPRYFAPDRNQEWQDVADTVDLSQRMRIARERLRQQTA